jgi:6-phosphogluconolactonase
MNIDPSIEVYHSAAELQQKVAERIILLIDQTITLRGVCFIAFSGGETPRPVYRMLGLTPMNKRIDWSHVHLFFTDERMVPPDDPQSNYGMINREFISLIHIPSGNVHRIAGENHPLIAAAEYEREVHEYFNTQIIRFDLIVLGLGDDGHTASLFPGTNVIYEKEAFAAAVYVPRLNNWRVTLTYRTINNAREIIFLVTGKKKANIVEHILKTSSRREDYPAALVRLEDGMIRWMLDKDAAECLEPVKKI